MLHHGKTVSELVMRLVTVAMIGVAHAVAGEAPDFGPSVRVFEPGAPGAQREIDAIFATQESGEFNANRYAILLKPGQHELNINIGFYTQVLGLGQEPGQVQVSGTLESRAAWKKNRNATCNFWRSAENLAVIPTLDGKTSTWAVSQGAWLRRLHMKGNLKLSDGGWSSGGFIADSVIDGVIDSGSQQQWFSRNAQWEKWKGGNWNMVFVGVDNPPRGQWPTEPYTVIDRAPIVREKPYLCFENDKYYVMSPTLQRDRRGASWKNETTRGERIPIEQFHVARSDRDTAVTINAALESGKHLLFTPGNYQIDRTINVSRPGTIVLGMGYPTLIASAGNVVMRLADVEGLTIAGVVFEAAEKESVNLLEVGEKGSAADHSQNPTFLFDLTCRAGGAQNGRCHTFVTIHSSHVVGENLWLWRADHGAVAQWDSNRNAHGLIVNGDDVTMYALFVEHCQEYQTIWNGERGHVYFYQSEMPYDPPSVKDWMNGPVRGFASYKVADHVKNHEAVALGVYCVFWDAPIIADAAIEAPQTPGVRLQNMITVRLNGKPESGINRVLNDLGEPVIHSKTSRLLTNK